ncbi:MAG: hypothetical protein ABI537_13985 [Casimicrobiaceae bacterium]
MTSTVATPELALVKKFLGIELEAVPRLPSNELVKIEDLEIDVICHDYIAEPDATATPTALGTWVRSYGLWSRDNTLLGTLFTWFERLASIPAWYWLGHPCKWAKEGLLGRNRAVRQPLQCHALQVESRDVPQTFARDFRLFDRLSIIYGGNFRGSIVLNYMLGILASGTVLFSLTVGRAIAPEHADSSVSVSTYIEIACLAAIAFVYLRGYTPDSAEIAPSMLPRIGSQRWHQRWLEYRVLAERFRYADMLLPLGKSVPQRLSIAPENSANKMWHHRYFKWRVADAVVPVTKALAYRKQVLALMIEQEHYHARNFERRGAIAHRLHRIAGICFALGLSICVLDNWVLEQHRDISLFCAALFPVLAAAIHGTLANTEYTKVAENSGDVAQEIHALVERLMQVPMPQPNVDADAAGLADVHDIVLEFAGTVINEATGWRSMLRDKNVPLAG